MKAREAIAPLVANRFAAAPLREKHSLQVLSVERFDAVERNRSLATTVVEITMRCAGNDDKFLVVAL